MELPLINCFSRPTPTSLFFTLDIHPDLRCFKGHFDMAPVLAGVVQVDWAIRLASEHFAAKLTFRGMQSIKFLRLIRPPLLLNLTIDYLPERRLLKFSYRDGEVTYSSGIILIAAEVSS